MIASSPGLHSAVNTLCSECLAPFETTTCAGEYFSWCRASSYTKQAALFVAHVCKLLGQLVLCHWKFGHSGNW